LLATLLKKGLTENLSNDEINILTVADQLLRVNGCSSMVVNQRLRSKGTEAG